MTATEDVFLLWEEIATDDEYDMVEAWKNYQAESWGNSYVATVRTALKFGMPWYIVDNAVKHYQEVVYGV